MTKNKIVCPVELQKQCLNTVNSYACKLRYFNGKCLFAHRKQKEIEKVVSK